MSPTGAVDPTELVAGVTGLEWVATIGAEPLRARTPRKTPIATSTAAAATSPYAARPRARGSRVGPSRSLANTGDSALTLAFATGTVRSRSSSASVIRTIVAIASGSATALPGVALRLASTTVVSSPPTAADWPVQAGS